MKNQSTKSKSFQSTLLSSFFEEENTIQKLTAQTEFWEKSKTKTQVEKELIKIEGELQIDKKKKFETCYFCLYKAKLIYFNKKRQEQGFINLKHKYFLKFLNFELKEQKYYAFQLSRGGFSQQFASIDKLKIFEWIDQLKALTIRIDFIDTYQYVTHIGEGNFAEVHKVQSIIDMQFYAAKIFYKDQLTKKTAATIKKEIEILFMLKGHKNILQLYEIFEEIDCIILITELMEGDLYHELKIVQQFTETEANQIFVQLLDALKFMKSKNVVHRDIKLDNILVEKKGLGLKDMKVKIADFGLADVIKKGEMLKTRCGTPGYMAPEIFTSRGYTEKVDIFSLGVLLYTLMNGSPPFKAKDLKQLIKKTQFQKIRFKKTNWSCKSILGLQCQFIYLIYVVIQLIKQMTEKNYFRRINLEQILESDWIQAFVQPQTLTPKSQALLPPLSPLSRSSQNLLSSQMHFYDVAPSDASKNKDLSIENLKTPKDDNEEEFNQINSIRSFFLQQCDSQSSRDSLYSNFSQAVLKLNGSNEQLFDQEQQKIQLQRSSFSPCSKNQAVQSKFSIKSPLLQPMNDNTQSSMYLENSKVFDFMEQEIFELSVSTDQSLEAQINCLNSNTQAVKTLKCLQAKF